MPSRRQERLGAYRQSFSRIDQDMLWSISCTRPHMVRGKVFAYFNSVFTLVLRIKYQNTLFGVTRRHFIWIWIAVHISVLSALLRDDLKWPHVLCQSVAFCIILYQWKADLLTKIITFGSMPWSGQLCNFTNSSWWKVDLKKCNYIHLSYTRAQEVRKTLTGKEGIITRKQLAHCSGSRRESVLPAQLLALDKQLKSLLLSLNISTSWCDLSIYLFILCNIKNRNCKIVGETQCVCLFPKNTMESSSGSTWPRGIKWFRVTWSKHKSFMNFNRPAHAS